MKCVDNTLKWEDLKLDYEGENEYTSFFSSTGNLHTYPAKAVPKMVNDLIKRVMSIKTIKTVVDPFVGSGTTALEFTFLSQEKRKEVLEFMENFALYAKLEINGQSYVLVHGGLGNFEKEKPLDAYTLDELVWTRADYSVPYYQDKIVVTGHTPTQLIPGSDRRGYIYQKNNHIALDCGACFSEGRLAGICLETGECFYAR